MTPSIKSSSGWHHFLRRYCRSVLVNVVTFTTELNNHSGLLELIFFQTNTGSLFYPQWPNAEPSPANEVREHKLKVRGTKINWTFAYKNKDILRLQLCTVSKILCSCLKKQRYKGRQRLLASFISGPYNRLKNLSAAMKTTKTATRILLRRRGLKPKVKFFLQKNYLI